MKIYKHTPVLLQEVLEQLDVKLGQVAVDATLGGGGYSLALLKQVSTKGKVLSIDLDLDAIKNMQVQAKSYLASKNLVLVNENFRNIATVIKSKKFPAPDAIVADLGLSSHELDDSGRGFSFQKDEILDMRFGQHLTSLTAWEILRDYSEIELTQIFKNFGEEKFAKNIARNIVRKRLNAPLKRTTELVALLADSIPRKGNKNLLDSARRVFQALRIEVNGELEALESFLHQAFDLLKPSGKLAVVSFQSLEDRIVKHFFKSLERGCVCPKDFPICKCGKLPVGKILTKKPIKASLQEQTQNPRSQSAKLRVVQKI
jgi:16S rRNA (cytosine1402-N4)-methyltransferase